MDIVRNLNRRVGRIAATTGILLATVAPALVPVVASAATITERSIGLTSSVAGATSSYEVKFTTTAATTGAYEIDFCDDPTIGTTCNAPTGFDASDVDVDADSVTPATASSAAANSVKVVITTPVSSGASPDVTLTGITNPSGAGVFYARIVTYEDGDAPGSDGNYNYTSATNLGTHLDEGSVALSATDGFAVDGKVLETLTFCVSGEELTVNCDSATTPAVSLGTSGVLDTSPGTDGDVFSYIATNAAHGAVVNLQSDAAGCGGLVRKGSTASDADKGCGIAPLTTGVTSIANSSATFGAKLTLTQPTAGAGHGTVAVNGNWGSDYYMNYDTDDSDATGVTSPYGDTVYTTSSGPTEFAGGKLSFNADRSELTPAGDYSANFSMIATGTF